jgi:hypothetical protein
MTTSTLLRSWILPSLLFCAALLAGALTHAAFHHPTYILVVDESRSLRTTDPDNLRLDALEIFCELLVEGDRVWVLGYGEIDRDLSGGIKTLSGRSGSGRITRDELQHAIRSLGSAEDWTNYGAPLQTVRGELLSWDPSQLEASPPYVFFLTDGQLSLPARLQETWFADADSLVGLVAELRELGARFCAVGLGNFERDLLLAMASAARLDPIFAARPEQLVPIFWKLFARNAGLFLIDHATFTGASEQRLDAELHEPAVRLYFIGSGPDPPEPFNIWLPGMVQVQCPDVAAEMRCAEGGRYQIVSVEDPPSGCMTVYAAGRAGHEALILQQGGIHWFARSREDELFPGRMAHVDLVAMAGNDTLRPPDYEFLCDPSLRMVFEGREFSDDGAVPGTEAQDGIISGETRIREHGYEELTVTVLSSTQAETVPVYGVSTLRRQPVTIKAVESKVLACWGFEHRAEFSLTNHLIRTSLGLKLSAEPVDVELSPNHLVLAAGETRIVRAISLPRDPRERVVRITAALDVRGEATGQEIHGEAVWRTIGILEWCRYHPGPCAVMLAVVLLLAALIRYIYIQMRRLPLAGRLLEIWNREKQTILMETLRSDHGRELCFSLPPDEPRIMPSGTDRNICLVVRFARGDKRRFEVLLRGLLLGPFLLGSDVEFESYRLRLT